MAAFWQDWCVATPPRHCPTVSTTAVIDFLTEMDDVGGVDNVLGNAGKVDFEPESVASDEEGIKLGRTSPDPPALGHVHVHVHTRLHSTPTQSCTPVESAMITGSDCIHKDMGPFLTMAKDRLRELFVGRSATLIRRLVSAHQ